MSNIKAIVRNVFGEVADEQDLFSTEHQAIIYFRSASIDEHEIKILEGMMISRAQKLGCSPFLLSAAMECYFRIDALEDLPSRQFESAMEYLLHFSGVN